MLKSIKISALVGLGLVTVAYEGVNGAIERLSMDGEISLGKWRELARRWLYRLERKSRKILVFILNAMVNNPLAQVKMLTWQKLKVIRSGAHQED